MIASYLSFPEYRDENGFMPTVARPARAAAPVPASDFRQELAAQAGPTPQAPQLQPQPQPRSPVGYHAFRDENGGPTVDERPAPPSAGGRDMTLFAEGNTPTGWDLLDFINPLQHIPIVNTIYREMTGDKIGVLPRLVGGALLGGPLGAAVTVANLMIEGSTGKDVGDHVLAMLRDGDTVPDHGTMLAETAPVPAAAPEVFAAAEPVAAGGMLPVFDTPQPARIAAETRFMATPQRAAAVMPMAAMTLPAEEPAAAPLPTPTPPPARPARVAAAAPPPAPADPQSQVFVDRFMNAMDKYDRARRLGN